MNCKEARKFLAAFADDQLDVRTNAEVLDHIEMCRACAGRVERLRRLGEAVAHYVGSVRASDEFRERVFEAAGSHMPISGRLHEPLGRLAGSRWFATAVAAASILLVFGAVYRFLVAPPTAYNNKAILAHMGVVGDTINRLFNTTDPQRAKRLALFKMDVMPEVPLLDRDEFELIGAGPGEIAFENVGHFVFRYKDTTVSMFVFEGLKLDEIRGRDLLTAFGPAKAEKRGEFCLLAWRQDSFTYILVSRLPMRRLVQMLAYGRQNS